MAFNRLNGNWLYYRAGRDSAPDVTITVHGGNVDVEARSVLQELVTALKALDLLAPATP